MLGLHGNSIPSLSFTLDMSIIVISLSLSQYFLLSNSKPHYKQYQYKYGITRKDYLERTTQLPPSSIFIYFIIITIHNTYMTLKHILKQTALYFRKDTSNTSEQQLFELISHLTSATIINMDIIAKYRFGKYQPIIGIFNISNCAASGVIFYCQIAIVYIKSNVFGP